MPDSAKPPSSTLFSFRAWILVGLAIALTGSIRFRLLDLPLERDEGEYAYVGQLIRQGIPPYQSAYNMKLPGAYLAYAAGMSVFGESTRGVHLTGILVNTITIPMILLLGRRLFGVHAGIAASVTYALLSASPGVGGLAAHANHFVVLFAVPGSLMLLHAAENGNRARAFLSGLLFGLAFLMKQQGLFFALFALLYFSLHQIRTHPSARCQAIVRGWPLILGMVVPFALTCLILAWSGVFPKFWFWTITYARSYATELSPSEGLQMLAGYLKGNGGPYLGFVLLAASGLAIAFAHKRLSRNAIWLGVFVLFSFCATATGLYFRRQYFILLLPGFSLAAGFAVASWQEFIVSRAKTGKTGIAPPALLAVVCMVFLISQRAVFFQLTPNQACSAIYPGNPFVQSVAAAEFIRLNSAPGDSVAVLGSEPQIYFYSHRPSATGHIYTYALMEPQPFASNMQRDMIREIESSRPRYLVEVAYATSWAILPNSDLTILQWMRDYSSRYYERAAIIDTISTGQSMFVSGDDARRYHSSSTEGYLTIYRRKAGE